jgi:4-amino-4-deoxy-L-arabinose transferase-like glycosyltransferase
VSEKPLERLSRLWRTAIDLPAKIGWRDHVIAALIASAYIAWLLSTARSLGFARDEGFYFHAAQSYSRWFELLMSRPHDALRQQSIDAVWSENHEHPSLMKSLFAFSWMLFYKKWQLFSDASTAFRFPGMLMMGLSLWVTYLFGARVYSRRAGVMAAVLLGLMPRVFYNAHLACFDIGIVAMWTWCIYVYWRSQVEGGLGWAIATGVVYGLTLDTKHNSWVLPFVLVPHALFVHRKAILNQLRVGRITFPASIVAMATIGPLVWYSLWPWIWNDTLPRLQEYFAFHLNHVYYNMEFLHETYFSAPSPRGYMPVMILATVPTVTLVLFVIGLAMRAKTHFVRLRAWGLDVVGREDSFGWRDLVARLGKRDRAESDLLFVLAFCAALAPWLLPKTPIFGGTKHWLTAYPFLCLFAGYAFDRIADLTKRTLHEARGWADGSRNMKAAQVALVACVVLGPLAETAHSHPFGLSSYVALVGGTAGGADLGLNRQFWGFTTESLEPYFEAHAPRGATVYYQDTAGDSWQQMITEKRIRPDLRGTGSLDADISIVHLERHMLEVEYNLWSVFGTDIPDYVLTHDGVPIIDVFRKTRPMTGR